MAESPETFGERVRRLRKAHDWAQQDLARESGVSLSAITRIERGETQRVDIQTLESLADAFRVSLDYLRGRETPPAAEVEEARWPLQVCVR